MFLNLPKKFSEILNFLLLFTLISSIGPISCSSRKQSSNVMIQGAGASFPYPVYSRWFSDYSKLKTDVRINYNSIGSGGGIQQLQKGTVDFGASDAPMDENELKSNPLPVLHLPMVMGAVVLSYNLQINQPLRLTGPIISSIYLGKITKWNDPQIVSINPGITLPDQNITVTQRSDGSGTTYVFTDYLSKVSTEWLNGPGKGKSIKWPIGLGAKGNEGVTSLIKQQPGSIGYVELVYALVNKVAFASLQNQKGEWIAPSSSSVRAAASEIQIPDDFRVSLTNSSAAGAYPLASFTYILIYNKMGAEKGRPLLSFLDWALSDEAQNVAEKELHYTRLPQDLVQKLKAKLQSVSISDSGSPQK